MTHKVKHGPDETASGPVAVPVPGREVPSPAAGAEAPSPAAAPVAPAPVPADQPRTDSGFIARVGVIAAAYAAGSLATMLFLGSLAWGPIQFRVSEALCVLALFTPAAVPGLALGCAIANVANIALSGTGMLGLLDVVFGSLATFIGASLSWRLRRRPALALAGPVVANALIVPAYLPLLLKGIGFYTIPFTAIALDASYPFMYLFGLVTTGAGEAVIMYVLGYPLYRSLAKVPFMRRELESADTGR